MIAVGSPCPSDAIFCDEQDATNNGFPSILSVGQSCPTGEACYEILDYFDWTDTFNGTAGGISTAASYSGSVDPGSGAGGITLIDVNGVAVSAVPEPSALAVMIPAILLIGCVKRRRHRIWSVGVHALSGGRPLS